MFPTHSYCTWRSGQRRRYVSESGLVRTPRVCFVVVLYAIEICHGTREHSAGIRKLVFIVVRVRYGGHWFRRETKKLKQPITIRIVTRTVYNVHADGEKTPENQRTPATQIHRFLFGNRKRFFYVYSFLFTIEPATLTSGNEYTRYNDYCFRKHSFGLVSTGSC